MGWGDCKIERSKDNTNKKCKGEINQRASTHEHEKRETGHKLEASVPKQVTGQPKSFQQGWHHPDYSYCRDRA